MNASISWRRSPITRPIVYASGTAALSGSGAERAEVVLNPRTQQAVDTVVAERVSAPLPLNEWGNGMAPNTATAIVGRLASRAGITHRVTPHALRQSYLRRVVAGRPLRDMQRAACHVKADTTVAYDQFDRPFHRDPTLVLMAATARSQPICDVWSMSPPPTLEPCSSRTRRRDLCWPPPWRRQVPAL